MLSLHRTSEPIFVYTLQFQAMLQNLNLLGVFQTFNLNPESHVIKNYNKGSKILGFLMRISRRMIGVKVEAMKKA